MKPGGNPLSYSGAETVVVLAYNMTNQSLNLPVFLYYDQNFSGTEAALVQPVSVTAIRLVKIQLELEKNPTASPVPLHAETTVLIRNLKTE